MDYYFLLGGIILFLGYHIIIFWSSNIIFSTKGNKRISNMSKNIGRYVLLIYNTLFYFISDIPQLRFFTRKVLFIDRVTGQDNNFEGVITKVIYDQTINTTSIKTSVMETSIETRILKVGDLIIIKEDQILYKGTRFQHVFIFLTIDLTLTYGQCIGMRQVATFPLLLF